MNRRDFLKAMAVTAAVVFLPKVKLIPEDAHSIIGDFVHADVAKSRAGYITGNAATIEFSIEFSTDEKTWHYISPGSIDIDREVDYNAYKLDYFGISSGAVRDRMKQLQSEYPDLDKPSAYIQAVMEAGQNISDNCGY